MHLEKKAAIHTGALLFCVAGTTVLTFALLPFGKAVATMLVYLVTIWIAFILGRTTALIENLRKENL